MRFDNAVVYQNKLRAWQCIVKVTEEILVIIRIPFYANLIIVSLDNASNNDTQLLSRRQRF